MNPGGECCISLAGRVAIVTGAARGIGYAVADLLSASGASVVLQDVDSPTLVESCAQLEGAGRKVMAVAGDVSRPADVESLVEETVRSWRRIDILVNNAGIGGVGKTLLELSAEEWQRMLDVDLTGVFLCCRAVLPHMIARRRGSIINLASITGQTGVAGSTHYAAAKAGVIGFSKSLAHELAPYYVNVNVVAPGLIDTDMSRLRGINHQRDRVIWPRIGHVRDVAWSVAYLASDHAEFITGMVLNVNGGAYM
jgi:NAD(P)-dependent dehydrogenase (short-subunit alcohol dehydrogenase family)